MSELKCAHTLRCDNCEREMTLGFGSDVSFNERINAFLHRRWILISNKVLCSDCGYPTPTKSGRLQRPLIHINY